MLEALSAQLRSLVYVVIWFTCLLQLTQGSPYQRYLKLFSYLLVLSICTNLLLSAVGSARNGVAQADRLYEEWLRQWQTMQLLDTTQLEEYDSELEQRILQQAQEEYEQRKESYATQPVR